MHDDWVLNIAVNAGHLPEPPDCNVELLPEGVAVDYTHTGTPRTSLNRKTNDKTHNE